MKLDEITKSVESTAKKFKPKVETIINSDLEDVVIKTDYHPNKLRVLTYTTPNTISINSNCDGLLTLSKEELRLVVLHELGHQATYKINPTIFEADQLGDDNLIDEYFKSTISRFFIRLTLGSNTPIQRSLIEGFAEYFSLDLLKSSLKSAKELRREYLLWDYSFYGVGYRFFRKVATKLGKRESFEIIKNPQVSFKELMEPRLYIQRRKSKNA